MIRAVVATFLLSVIAAQAPAVGSKVGEAVFPAFLNGDGRQLLSDFHGQPVVIDQWGIH